MLRTIHPWIAIIAFLCFMSACKPSPSDLFRAIDAGDVKAVKRAATVPSNVSAMRSGWTPLHVICNLNETSSVPAAARQEIVAVLIAAGANVNGHGGAKETTGLTPLCFAAVFGLQSEAQLLLNAGADPNLHSTMSSSSLHYAVQGGNVDIVKLLLAHKADPNFHSSHALETAGMNSLHLAARGIPRGGKRYDPPPRQAEMLRDLVAAGADISALDASGRTPRQVAEAFNQPEAASLLREMETANSDSNH